MAEEEFPSTWAPATYIGNSAGVAGFWPCSGCIGLLGGKPGDGRSLISSFLCHSAFWMNIYFFNKSSFFNKDLFLLESQIHIEEEIQKGSYIFLFVTQLSCQHRLVDTYFSLWFVNQYCFTLLFQSGEEGFLSGCMCPFDIPSFEWGLRKF